MFWLKFKSLEMFQKFGIKSFFFDHSTGQSHAARVHQKSPRKQKAPRAATNPRATVPKPAADPTAASANPVRIGTHPQS